MDDLDNRILQSDGAPLWGDKPPAVAGFYRGLLLAFLIAVCEGVISFFTNNHDPIPGGLLPYVPLIVTVAGMFAAGLRDQASVQKAAETRATVARADAARNRR